MLSISRQQRKQRIRQLIQELELRKEQYYQKYERARSEYRKDFYWGHYKTIGNVISHYYQSTLLYVNNFGETDILQHRKAANYKQAEAARIESGKQKFLTTHYYSPWFLGTSVSDDYGTYSCDRCNRTFYHSPSRITRAKKTVYDCCCGYCTNEIIQRDHNELPYS